MHHCFLVQAYVGLCLTMPVGTAAVAEPPTVRYTVTDLGTLGGATSIALGINDRGQVVGGAQTAHGVTHAFLWERGRMTDLGAAAPDAISIARAVNNIGQAVGESSVPHGPMHALIWQHGRATDWGTLGDSGGAVNAINDHGQVVGQLCTPSGERRAFRWEAGPVQKSDTLGGNLISAKAINNRGQVIGAMNLGHGDDIDVHGFVWAAHRIVELGAFAAQGINDHGQAVGAVSGGANPYSSAAMWLDGQMTRLPTPNSTCSIANDINNWGQIVGSGGIVAGGARRSEATSHAFCWAGGKCVDLNGRIAADAGWLLEDAEHINARGQIVGLGEHGGKQRAFLLTPIGGSSENGDRRGRERHPSAHL